MLFAHYQTLQAYALHQMGPAHTLAPCCTCRAFCQHFTAGKGKAQCCALRVFEARRSR